MRTIYQELVPPSFVLQQDKKAQLEREREQRIAEGDAEGTTNNPRLTERQKLTSMFDPLELTIRDIKPDGHCLYAALSDQLNLRLNIKVNKAGTC